MEESNEYLETARSNLTQDMQTPRTILTTPPPEMNVPYQDDYVIQSQDPNPFSTNGGLVSVNLEKESSYHASNVTSQLGQFQTHTTQFSGHRMMSPIDIHNQAQLSQAFAGRRGPAADQADDEYSYAYGSYGEGGVPNAW
jgi:hypothetical protein